MTTAERLYEAMQDMPEPLVAEILDFAEFIRSKIQNKSNNSSDELLDNLAGGLESSITFAGEPLTIQTRLRDEWQ